MDEPVNNLRNSPAASLDSASAGSPGGAYSTDIDGHSATGAPDAVDNALTKVQSAPAKTTFISKTDKPRPHVCLTCTRSFARLEHLKRHERSHTKEKPFECPQCTRCFARRDLLLRHQQKLHMTTTPPSKGGKRRESVTSVASSSGKRGKAAAAAAAAAAGTPRPRANTFSHVDSAGLGIHGIPDLREEGTVDFNHYSSHLQHGYRNIHGLTRLATQSMAEQHGHHMMHSAPPVQSVSHFGYSPMQLNGSTVNPAQLHATDGMDVLSPFRTLDANMMDEEDYDWFRAYHAHGQFNEHAMASSPSVMSHASVGGANEWQYPDGNMSAAQMRQMMWPGGLQRHASMPGPSTHSMENGLHMLHMEQMSPHFANTGDLFTSTPPQMFSPHSHGHAAYPHMSPHMMMLAQDGSSVSSSSMHSSIGSSTTSVSTVDSITDVTRQALLSSLSQPSMFGLGPRKYSQPTISSPLRDSAKGASGAPSLPSTADLQRYVGAYIRFFHPHFPFLHIPTLTFDVPAYTTNLRFPASPGVAAAFGPGNVVGGGGCLVLALAAIGALYEQERVHSKECFEACKKMIQLYLEERRKTDVALKARNENATSSTPLWLVQAMLLNVVYGHNAGDKISSDIASNHCSALISLARAGGLLPASALENGNLQQQHMWRNGGHRLDGVPNAFHGHMDEQAQWHDWVIMEERKRTLFAIFHMSSLLVNAYNHAPTLMNSEIHLDLPCEEDLWNAETAGAFMAKGGALAAKAKSVPFASALSMLLTASQANGASRLDTQQPFGSNMPIDELPPSSLKPSTFGCLTLINALHNYIWETRQRHTDREWSTQETEAMQAHIEPALRAWQAAWASNPTHSLERPNPYGVGPLSADCIPLLDLAYVRLFVNLGMSKEAFWQRDFDGMAEELARGFEIIQHADADADDSDAADAADGDLDLEASATHVNSDGSITSHSSRRERHLRKAAFYAAEALSMYEKLGVTFADFTSRELPLQAGLCTFDCAQILAEWIATVQERVGPYLGILGRDNIDLAHVPAAMLLEDDDVRLLDRVADISAKMEAKVAAEVEHMDAGTAAAALQQLQDLAAHGFGSRILTIAAFMFTRAAVWPVTSVMAEGLGTHATHVQRRAEQSVQQMPAL